MKNHEFSQQFEKKIEAAGKQPYNAGNNLQSALHELDILRNFSNRYPARFEIYRYVQDHSIDADEKEAAFRVAFYEDELIEIGKTKKRKVGWKVRNGEVQYFSFPKLETIKKYSELNNEQLDNLVKWLTSEAMKDYDFRTTNQMLSPREYNHLTDIRRNAFEALIKSNGWCQLDTEEHFKFKVQFTKEHAYELGHFLKFSYDNMAEFIKRVFKDSIQITRNASDLIQVYCFSHGLSQEDALSLLELYNKHKNVPVDTQLFDELEPGHELTIDLHDAAVDYTGTKESFLNWLLSQKNELDQLSHSAYSLYTQLLSCAYLMLIIKYRLYYMRGKDVEALQTALNILDESRYNCPTNGIYDERTEKAVKAFQRNYSSSGIKATGIFGPTENSVISSELEKRLESTEAEINSILSMNGTHILTRNDKMESSDTVLAYQRALQYINIDRFGCKPDGIFGKDTESVIKKYQRFKKIKATGCITPLEHTYIVKDIQSIAKKRMSIIQECLSQLGTRSLFVNHDAFKKLLTRNSDGPEYYSAEEYEDERKVYIHRLWELLTDDKEDMTIFFDEIHDDFFLPSFLNLNWNDVSKHFQSVSLDSFLLYLTTDKSGHWKINSIFDRIPVLMSETRKEEITKPDLLCLLWLIYALDMTSGQNKDKISELIHDFVDFASSVLREAHFSYYRPSLLEYSIERSLTLCGYTQDLQDVYSTLLTMGYDSPLTIDICIKIPAIRKRVAVRFYGCDEDYSYFSKLLYQYSSDIKKRHYSGIREYLSIILESIREAVQCGCEWEWLKEDSIPDYFWSFILTDKGIIIPEQSDNSRPQDPV